MELLNIPDNMAKRFALAPKNLVLSIGKIFHFQNFTGFLKLHLFLDLDALCAPLTISILFSTIWDIFGQSDYLIQLEILLPTYLFKYELFYALIISLAHIWFLGNYEC